MRDLLLIVPDQPGQGWNLDFDIINGRPTYVPEARNTQDQRAAVAAYIFQGSIPGKPDIGVNWSSLYEADYEKTLVTVDNTLKQNIQQYAATPSLSTNNMYVPVYNVSKDGIELTIYQG
jgi:hypothetical protein